MFTLVNTFGIMVLLNQTKAKKMKSIQKSELERIEELVDDLENIHYDLSMEQAEVTPEDLIEEFEIHYGYMDESLANFIRENY